MNKIKFKADTLKEIVQSIFNDADVNEKVTSADDQKWVGKTINDILNVEYYTFEHRVMPTEKVEILQSGQVNLDTLSALSKSYCLVEIQNIKRLFSKDIDEIEVTGSLQYQIQPEKIKLLESLIELANLSTCGLKIPLKIGENEREFVIYFDNVDTSEIDTTTIGESVTATVMVTLLVMPKTMSYIDYTVQFLINEDYVTLPIKSLSFANSMTQKGISRINKPSATDTINLSNATIFTLVFDGYKDNEVVRMFANNTLSQGCVNRANANINKTYQMKITRDGTEFEYLVCIKDHSIIPNNSIENETHSLTLTTGEIYNGN